MKNEADDELDEVLGSAVQEMTKSTRDKKNGGVVLPAELNEHVLAKLMDAQHRCERAQSRRLVSPSRTEIPSRKKFIMLAKFAVAASLLAAVVGTTMFGILGGHTSLYAQVAERLTALQSLACRVQFVDENALIDVDASNGQKLTYLAPCHYRLEYDEVERTEIINGETREYLVLHQGSTEAMVMTGRVVDSLLRDSPVRLINAVRKHFNVDRKVQDGVKELGTRSIDGEQAVGMRSEIDGEVIEAWFDPQSHLPVLVRVRFEIPGHLAGGRDVSMWRVMSHFEFDIPVDRELFSTDLPEGYTRVAVEFPEPDTREITLDDLVKLLRVCAEANDLQFPLSLTANDEVGTPLGIQSEFGDQFEQQFSEGGEAQREAIKAISEFASSVARGTVFLFTMNEGNRFRYFGGARLNEVDRPVLWYSPEGDNQFKIVYADLTVQDVDADALPPEPAAIAKESDKRNVRVSTPRFELPRSAIRDFDQLQEIRRAGKQQDVEYLVLGWMPELIESAVSFNPQLPLQQQVVPDGWQPDRAADSNRLAFLSEFTNLKGLDLIGLYLTQFDLDSVAKCQSLQRLSLSGIRMIEIRSRRLNGNDLKRLAELSRLELLDLSQANITGGLQHLSSLPRLHTLFLSSSEHLNDRSIAELKVLPHLETLVLAPVYLEGSEKSVSDAGLQSLQLLPQLKTLYVGYHGKFTLPVQRLRELLPNVDVKAPLDGVPAQ